MLSISLTPRAFDALCENKNGFAGLKPSIKHELTEAGFDSVILFIADFQFHLQFQTAAQQVMFKLKYSELLL